MIINNKLIEKAIVIDGQYNEYSETVIVTKNVFDKFYSVTINNSSMPIIWIFPNKEDVIRYQSVKKKQYSSMLSCFVLKGYNYVDLMDVLEHADVEQLFVYSHCSPDVNKLGNKRILSHLRNMNIRRDRKLFEIRNNRHEA